MTQLLANQWTRRDFLATSSIIMASGLCSGWKTVSGETVKSQEVQHYSPRLGDRLWMWGHENPKELTADYAIPEGPTLLQAEACQQLGIPNDCVVRWCGLPKPPFDEYIKQFKNTKRVGWSIQDSAPEPFEVKKQMAFDLVEKLPNLTTIFLDDYFKPGASPKLGADGKSHYEAHLTVERIQKLREEMDHLSRPVDLAAVLYSHQLHPEIREHLVHCNIVSLWTWNGSDLSCLEKNFDQYRKIMPDKRTLLGIYMWDFGGKRPLTIREMEQQCAFALDKFKSGAIEGMIFHCTPLVGRGIAAVEWSHDWIARNKDVVSKLSEKGKENKR